MNFSSEINFHQIKISDLTNLKSDIKFTDRSKLITIY